MANVRLENIYKSFDGIEVLHDINLCIDDGEFAVLVGPSGCGKSTTLRIIAGLEEVTSGRVMINEKVVNAVSPQHRNIAMVFQNYALYPHKKVRDNILFGLKRSGAPGNVVEQRLSKVAALLELQDFLDRKPAELSGGQRQRVAMGRAIVRDADVYLFDEPLSNLDATLRHQMRSEIRRIHRQMKTTSIYVTHDQVEAMTLGDRVVVIRDGRIEQQGRPMDIYLKPVNIFVATFIGAPSMNILDATLLPGFIDLEGQRIPFESSQPQNATISSGEGKKIKLGIRPDFFLDAGLAGKTESLATLKGARIDLVEPLGFDREFIVRIGIQELKVRLDLRTTAAEGEKIDLCFDPLKIHVFDVETGRNLSVQQ